MVIPDIEFATKYLMPKRSGDAIPRRRLLDVLHSNIGIRSQTLTAPAGYGKTTLLVDFASEIEIPVCWYSLDSSDQDPRLLMEGILSSIQFHFAGFGQLTQSRLDASKDLTKEAPQIVGVLTGEMYASIPDYFVLILEDYHAIECSEQAGIFLNLLLERSPDNCHIIISSRTPMELPALSKLHLQKLAMNLSLKQLAFTAFEVRDLLATNFSLSLTDDEANALVAKTEGWIVGILLSAYSLRAGKPQKETMAVSHEDVFHYLASEVYDKQTPEIQSFLLSSSTLDEIEPDFCDRLLDLYHSRQLLHDIERKNLFIQCIDYEKALYRYHQLFREFLQRKFLEESTEEYILLHTKAGLLFEGERRWHEAVTHFFKARGYSDALRIIKSVGPELQKAGKWATVSRWIEALPESLRSSDNDLILLQAQNLIYLGEANESARLLTDLLSRTTEDSDFILRAKALIWRNNAFRLTGHFVKARTDIKDAIHLLEQHNNPADILGDAYKRLGNTHGEQGQFRSSLKYLKRALRYFSSVFDLAQMADIHNSLGIVYKRLGDLVQANTHFEYAREYWSKVKNYGALAITLNNISFIYQRGGQYDLALQTLRLGLSKAQESGYRHIEACILINIGEMLRDLGAYQEALGSYSKGLELARDVMESYYVISAKAGLGETYRLLSDQDRAEVLIEEAIAQAKEQGMSYEVTLFTTQLGVIDYERGRYDNAIKTLRDVCTRLKAMSDKDALAKASFHLAQAFFLTKQYDVAVDYLKKVSDLADDLGYDEFLAVEGRNAVMLMEYAISKGVGTSHFASAVEKINKRRSSQPLEGVNFNGKDATGGKKPDFEVRAFGETEVIMNSHPVTEVQWRSHRAKEIFFYLLCSDTGQTREVITTSVWPDLPPARATSNFHINLYRVRRALHPRILILERGRYRINPSLDIWFDVNEFEHLLNQTENSSSLDLDFLPNLEQARKLYRGPFLNEVYSDWAEIKRRLLEDKYLKAISLLARLYSERCQHAKAVTLLEDFVSIDPYHDEVYCQLMEQHLAMNNEVSASLVYRRYIETVAREMDCPPSVRMRALHNRLLTAKKTT